MIQLAIPVFVLMSGAALLGFVVAWTWRKMAIQSLQSELIQVKNVNFQIESERHNLVQHTNLLKSEKESLLRYQSELGDDKKELIEHLQALNAEKTTLERLLHQHKNNESHSFNQEELIKLETRLKNQQTEILEKEEEIKKYRQRIAGQLSAPDVEELKKRFKNKYSEKKQKWEEKYQNLHFKLLKVARERDELKKGIFPNEVLLDYSNNKKSKEKSLDKIKRKFTEWQDRPIETGGAKKIGFISSDYGELEKNTKEESEEIVDNLKVLSGINEHIEVKLNALGVYRYEQISRLEDKDILLINKILDLDSQYILQHEWVSEAKKFK